MAYKDLLLQLSSYPEATPPAAVEQAVSFAGLFEAQVTALTFEIEFHVRANPLALAVVDLLGMAAAERSKSIDNARDLTRALDDIAARHNVGSNCIVERSQTSQVPEIVTEYARLRDLTIIPVGESSGLQHQIAESVIFGSGRPVLVVPEAPKSAETIVLDTVGVAWDFSRPAARAIADALPLLQRARSVRAVTITNEKTIVTRRAGSELVRHLACHGVEVVFEEEDAGGRSVGQALEAYADARNLDVLVMGAYGHSRVRDFILGGATKSIVASPPLPVLLSH
jgi:nucleotide-binding universal stress UspA family protein